MKYYYLLWLLLGLGLPGRAQSLDPTFQPTGLFSQDFRTVVVALAAQPDGKVLAAGNFQAAGGALGTNVLGLNADLSRDLSFRPALGANGLVQALAVQPNGKVLIGGLFTDYAGTSTGPVARLLPTGELDPTFRADPALLGGQVAALAVQPDAACWWGGGQCQPAPTGLVRLLPSGGLDATFQPAAGLAPLVPQALLPDGRLLVQANAQLAAARLRCLLPDGTTDPTFAPVAGTSAGYPTSSWSVTLQPGDYKPVLFGDFSEVAGQPRTGLARLSAASPLAVRVRSVAASPLRFYPNPTHQRVTLVLPTTLTQAGTVQLYDALGRDVGHQPVPAHAKELTLSLTGLPPGFYLLRFGASTGHLAVE